MKRFITSIFVFLIILLLSVSIIIANNSIYASNSKIDEEKIYYEIEYFDYKIIYIFNLLNNEHTEINWKELEKETYNLYNYWNSVILDLNYLDIKKEYLTDFGKDLDNLALSIKQQNKKSVLKNIVNLYNKLTIYVQEINNNDYRNILLAKYNLLLAYSTIETQNWTLIYEYILKASETIYKVVNTTNEKQYSQYNINQAYVAIKELENIINIKDVDIFNYKCNNAINKLENI